MNYVFKLKCRDSYCVEKVNLIDVWKKSISNLKIINTLKMSVYEKIYHKSINHKKGRWLTLTTDIVSLKMQKIVTN